MDMNLVHIVYELRTDEPLAFLPHLYDAVRRFENYFITAVPRSTGREEGEYSPHSSVFGQILSTDPDVVRRHQKPPLPFAFRISEAADIASGFELAVVVAGSAIQHISIFLGAIALMLDSVGEESGVEVAVSERWSVDYQGGYHELHSDSHPLIILSALEIIKASRQSGSVGIIIETPLRLLRGGVIVPSFDFGLLVRAQLRRCSSFFAYYGEGELELDYRALSAAADKVSVITDSFDFRKPKRAPRGALAGIVGRGEFTDIADGVMPLLTLGSYLNAGKGAAFGMGAYRVVEV